MILLMLELWITADCDSNSETCMMMHDACNFLRNLIVVNLGCKTSSHLCFFLIFIGWTRLPPMMSPESRSTMFLEKTCYFRNGGTLWRFKDPTSQSTWEVGNLKRSQKAEGSQSAQCDGAEFVNQDRARLLWKAWSKQTSRSCTDQLKIW